MDSFYGDFAFPQFTFLPPHVPVQVVIFANRLEVDCKNKNFNKRFSFFSQKTVGLYVTLHLHVILIYNHATENEFDFYCLLKKVKKNQWFTPRQHRNYLIMTQSYVDVGLLVRTRQKIMTTVSSWITLSITWWSDIALVPKSCNCRR